MLMKEIDNHNKDYKNCFCLINCSRPKHCFVLINQLCSKLCYKLIGKVDLKKLETRSGMEFGNALKKNHVFIMICVYKLSGPHET